VLWPCTLGADNPTEGQANLKNAFSITSNTVGSQLKIAGIGTENSKLYTYTEYQPLINNASAHTPGAYVEFAVTPSKGLSFTPASVSFKTTRFGTDGGFWGVYYVTKDTVETLLKSDIKPARNNVSPFYSDVTINIPDSLKSDGEGIIRMYIYTLGNTKQFGLSNVQIKGFVSGTLVPVVKHALTAVASPAAGGSVIKKPNSDTYDEGTAVTLTASRSFGYQFVNWTDSVTGKVVSTESAITQTMNGDIHLIANFKAINTYSLTTSVSEGAAGYMVVASPAGTTVDGKTMYEEGDVVQLTANSNPAYTFTGWSDGQTNSVVTLTMNENKSVVANYEASNYVCGWDFHNSGNMGRVTDFHATSDNETTNLILRKADGTAAGWLDKSYVKGSYEGAPAAVNWQPLTDKYYYQTCINATNYTNLSVQSVMLYNYNAYQTQKLEYSLDDTNWTTLTSVNLPDVKVWTAVNAALPSACDHAAKLYLRWIPDYTSSVVGTTYANDGTSISAIYVMGTDAIFNDGKAPVLQSSVPGTDATNASASGKIVLTYDKKVQIAADAKGTICEVLVTGTSKTSVDGTAKTLTPVVTGKTITFSYSGLKYGCNYAFILPGNVVSDLSGNVQKEPVGIGFTTMQRTAVTKALYDFIVDGTTGKTIVDAINAANAQTSGNRYRIFVKNGKHDLGNVLTALNTPNISLIGENEDSTIIYNHPTVEGIGVTATIQLGSTATNVYMQDVTLKNAFDYQGTTGRAVALQDKGDKNIFKNVKLLSYQDTYYSNNATMRSYFEDCEIHGVVDFICGSGDIFFNRNLLYLEDRAGNCITAPATTTNWGYVFSNCTIDGAASNNGSYHLGRNWQGTPRCVYLNTMMKQLPAGEGWTDMSATALPALFAEYGSVTASGSSVDCSSRKTVYTAGTVTYCPVLSAADAATYTIENVLGGSDQWVPTEATEQESAPLLTPKEGSSTVSWTSSDYALLYAVCLDGKVMDFTTESIYTFKSDVTGKVTVRSANELGGLGLQSNAISLVKGVYSGISDVTGSDVLRTDYYNVAGMKLNKSAKGITIQRQLLKDGQVKVKSYVK
jgi:pectin methylesterase-like acyl-CoA thioesterase